jgi:hypothetical protein
MYFHGYNITLILLLRSTALVPKDCAPLPAVLPPVSDSAHPHSLMWVQRERVFSRWKERVVVITKDYLQCFKKGSTQLSNVGRCIFKVDNSFQVNNENKTSQYEQRYFRFR